MIDTHAHLFLSELSADVYIRNAQAAGVERIVSVATDLATSAECVRLAAQYPMIIATAGVHPCEEGSDNTIDALRAFVMAHPVAAIGEIGLDGYRSPVPMEDQIVRFVQQLELAREVGLPVIIHCRKAADPMISVIASFHDVTKVFHCFSEDRHFIDAVSSTETYFSFTGNVTYDNAKNSRYAASVLPLDRIMLETDAPYMTPTPYKGAPNESGFLRATAEAIAQLRQIETDALIDHTTLNARRFFRLTQ